MPEKRVLILEAFHGGSHKQLTDLLIRKLKANNVAVDFVFMTDKKWQWRMRTSAMYFSNEIPNDVAYTCVFVTAVINLAELMGLRPDLNAAHKVLYFHENQLTYPVRKQQDRDFQYGYNQIVSCLCADQVLFNSKYNMDSFLTNIDSHMRIVPDYRMKNLNAKISPKCQVLYYALNLKVHENPSQREVPDTVSLPKTLATKESGTDSSSRSETIQSQQLLQQERLPTPSSQQQVPTPTSPMQQTLQQPLHIVWAHRWEHDKNPEDFFNVLFQLAEEDLPFCVSVLGQSFTDNPSIFVTAKEKLGDRILNWGYCESKDGYLDILSRADVAVSTANHEFFGVSMLEAVSQNCYPLCPNRLVYPEFFPSAYLYNTNQQLVKKLRYFCRKPYVPRHHHVDVDVSRFSEDKLVDEYLIHLMK